MDLGYDSISLHLPFGRSLYKDSEGKWKFVKPMEYDGYYQALSDPDTRWLTEGFEDAWGEFVEEYNDPNVPYAPVCSYVGTRPRCKKLNEYLDKGKIGTAMWYDMINLNDILNSGQDLCIDAFIIDRNGDALKEDDENHAFLRGLQARGVRVSIETHPFKEQEFLFDVPCRTSLEHWKQAWKKETQRLTCDEVVLSPGINRSQVDDDAEWIEELVTRGDEVLSMGKSFLIQRGDIIANNFVSPQIFWGS
jgi:hypothetical protein